MTERLILGALFIVAVVLVVAWMLGRNAGSTD